MKNAFPLYAKILLWFFLNLLVLGAGSYLLLRVQFRIGPEFLLVGRAGERFQRTVSLIREELNTSPRTEWNTILERFSNAYQVQFLLFQANGQQLAGPPTELPARVWERILDRPGRREPARERRRVPSAEDATPPPRVETSMPGAARPPFIERTSQPSAWWIGLRTPLREEPGLNRPGPAMLLIKSESLRAGGLLLDFTLWLWVGAAAVAFSVLFWIPLVRGITRSVGQMTHATAQIAEGKFDVRVNESRRDELGVLGHGINQMAARLAGFVSGQKRFLGDIAHELCSPIARMQMAVGILEARAPENQKDYVEDLREEVQHMSNLVNELLSFSKASMAGATANLQTVELRPLVEKAVRREAHGDADIRLQLPETFTVVADPELVVRAVANLLRNAIVYAAKAGPIQITARQAGEEIELCVADEGPGVPETEIPKLFDPFYRVDKSRTRGTGGVGLGLSIVKTCVEACHGSVTCRNRQPHGLEVVIRLKSQSIL